MIKTKYRKVIEIDLLKELKRIADIPKNSRQRCHEDHKEMTEELYYLIKFIKDSNKC